MRTALGILPNVFDADFDSFGELQSAISGRHNLLLEGPIPWIATVLRSLTPLLDAPVTLTTSRRLPVGESGTVLLKEIDAMHPDDQARVFEWLQRGRRHVISTTTRSLFASLAQGGFDEALYYRLNVIRMRGPSQNSGDGRLL